MIEITKYGNFESSGKSKTKYQIILTHSSRNSEDYLNSLLSRYNGKYHKIPNYFIDRKGKIYNLLSNIEYSKFFYEEKLNKNSIIICLENLGWLNKEPLKDYYVNWIGDIYNGKVVDKKWRDYFFWQPYTEIQVESTILLCKKLFEDIGINKESVGNNTKINGIEKFEGVTTRSNYNINHTDLSPAFDFDFFINEIEK